MSYSYEICLAIILIPTAKQFYQHHPVYPTFVYPAWFVLHFLSLTSIQCLNVCTTEPDVFQNIHCPMSYGMNIMPYLKNEKKPKSFVKLNHNVWNLKSSEGFEVLNICWRNAMKDCCSCEKGKLNLENNVADLDWNVFSAYQNIMQNFKNFLLDFKLSDTWVLSF